MASKYALMCALLVAAAAVPLGATTIACPVDSEEVEGYTGGYALVDPDSVSNLYPFVFEAIDDYLLSDFNTTINGTLAGNSTATATACNLDEEYGLNVYSACTQVVAGTNTIIEFTADACNMTLSGAVEVFTPLPIEDAPSEMVGYEIESELEDSMFL